jgi:hypothetical protein
MRKFVTWAFLLVVFAQFGGLAPVAAAGPQPRSKAGAEAQSRPQGPRLARLYFLREKGLWASEAGIKIDDRLVGSVSKGTYFSIEKPPGRYKITCVNPVSADYEAEVQIEGGHTYYFGVGTHQSGPPVQSLLNHVVSGSSGRQLPSSSPFKGAMAGAVLYQIDAAEGPAIIGRLKPQ